MGTPRSQPEAFAFFQAVRLLELEALCRGRQPVGHDFAPESESVRLRCAPALAFPRSEVRGLRDSPGTDAAGRARPCELDVAFLGLIGPLGALPQHYNELVLQRLRRRDRTLRDFLDLFHHRSLSFFYRAWRKYRLPFAFEASELEFEASQLRGEPAPLADQDAREGDGRDKDRRDGFTRTLFSLAGLGLRTLREGFQAGTHPSPGSEARAREHSRVEELAIAFYSGHLGHRPRSAAGLECLLGDCFGFPVRVEQFVGQWLAIPPNERSTLSAASCAGLGQGFVLGSRSFDVGSKVCIHAGPLEYSAYERVAPGRDGHERLRTLSRLYLGPGVDFDLSLELAPGNARPVRLGGGGPDGTQLGRNGWLASDAATARVEPAVFCMAHAPSEEQGAWRS